MSINYYNFIFLILIIYLYTRKRYLPFLPTIPLYPNNNQDALNVQFFVKNRNLEDISLFQLTDDSVVHAFKPQVDESISHMNQIITQKHIIFIILSMKTFFNRARPKQIIPDLDILDSKTAHTPAFPSGHAFQAYYLANHLSQLYPKKKELFNNIAEKCAMARVYAGIHYTSDNNFSKFLVNMLF